MLLEMITKTNESLSDKMSEQMRQQSESLKQQNESLKESLSEQLGEKVSEQMRQQSESLKQQNEILKESLSEQNEKMSEKAQMRLDEKMEEMKQTIGERLNSLREQIHEEVQTELSVFKCAVSEVIDGRIGDAVAPIQKKMVENDDRMKELQKQIETKTMSERIQIVMPSEVMRSDNEQKFYGDTRMNPKTFIKGLKDRLTDIHDPDQLKRHIRNSLRGDAEVWHDINVENYDTLDQFENVFLAYYWGDQVQAKVRENLFFGRYNPELSSRERYAMRKYAQASQLDPRINDADIIKYIARHFDEDIRNVIAVQDIETIERLLKYLRRIDDIQRSDRRPQNKNSTENRRGGGRTEQNTSSVYNKQQDIGRESQNNNRDRGRYQNNNYYQNNRYMNNRRNNNQYKNENNNYARGERRNSYGNDREYQKNQSYDRNRRSTSEERNNRRENWKSNEDKKREEKTRQTNMHTITKCHEQAIVHDQPKSKSDF